jgi:Raf kinase inhibitor-like YbhB/YbcL family protein
MGLKLFLLFFLLAAIAGCLANKESADTKEVDIMQTILISAEDFQAGGNIPDEYTCEGNDISPALSWKGVPAEAKSIALIMDDPDAPGRTFVHWVLFNIPANALKLPKGIQRSETLSDGSVQGITDFGRVGYGGPCPPPGKPHRYYFKLYALDTKLSLSPGASKKQVEDAMKGHTLAKGELVGKYGR